MYELCITLRMNMNIKIVKKNKEYSHALNEVWKKLQSIESMETNNIKIDIVNAQSSLLHNKCKGWSYAIQCIYKMITIHVRMRIHEHQPLKSHKLSTQFNFFQNFLQKCLPSNPAKQILSNCFLLISFINFNPIRAHFWPLGLKSAIKISESNGSGEENF